MAEELQIPDVSHMNKKQKLDFVKLLEEKINEVKQNKILRFYPDTGILAREKYIKHMSFFVAGAEFSERCFMAANRVGKCITYQTLIDTPDGQKTVGELFEIGKPFDVIAWDGNEKVVAKASAPFKKAGVHQCYKIIMSDGQWIECADHHRFLFSDGWRRLSEYLEESGSYLLQSKQASYSPLYIDGNRIISINPIGSQEVYDFTVKKYHNYCAGGLVHHNTEGVGCYEMTLHLTGNYPSWWEGRRFTTPVVGWAATTTNEKTRDILQRKYYGPINEPGTGMIPAQNIVDSSRRSGIPDALESIIVKHFTDGVHDGDSVLYLKSFAQGRDAFQGEEVHVIHLDEEPPMDVYTECLLRTMATEWFDGGIILATFTPMDGISEVTELFMPGAQIPDSNVINGRFMVNASWDDAPHLSEKEKERLWASIPPYQRDARTKGIPLLGEGVIYPIADEDIQVPDFPIPVHWPKAYALDVGWNCTAALWGTWDLENGILYVCAEYKRGQAEPLIHATNIKAKGENLNGVADPASRQSNQKDGTQLLDEYRKLGLNLYLADNAVEAGLFDVYNGFVSGKIKIFHSCMATIEEKRLYRRDKQGKVIKEKDHLMDCLRYLQRSGRPLAKVDTDKYINKTLEQFIDSQYNPLYSPLFGKEDSIYGEIRGFG